MRKKLTLAFDNEGKAFALNKDYVIYCENEETFEKVKEAVEKQKKKEVNRKRFSINTDLTHGDCPSCGNHVNNTALYCGNCGQALDWEVRK